MSFVNPQFLFALFSLSIPILIHLLNFRRYKKVYFTNVALLKEIELQSKNVKQLRHWLILAARLLGLTFLILAFAQPIIPVSDRVATLAGPKKMVFYVDNSFSMNQDAGGFSRLERAKNLISTIVSEESPAHSYILIDNDFKQSDLNQLNQEEFLESLSKLAYSSRSRNPDEVVSRMLAATENHEGSRQFFLISDFQKSQFPNPFPLSDTAIQTQLIQVVSAVNENISLDTCYFLQPVPMIGSSDSLVFKLTNHSANELTEFPIRLFINGQQRSLNTVNLQPGKSRTEAFSLKHDDFGQFACRIEIRDSPVSFDDELFFSYAIDSGVNVYHIGEQIEGSPFKVLYKPPFNYQSAPSRNIDVAHLSASSLIIIYSIEKLPSGLVSEINDRVQDGASLIVIPRDTSALYTELLKTLKSEELDIFDTSDQEINQLTSQAEALHNVFERIPDHPNFPLSTGHFRLRKSSGIFKEDILSYSNGEPALRKYRHGKGQVYLFTTSIQKPFSNISRHSLFVPLFLNMAYHSQDRSPAYYMLGQSNLIAVDQQGNNDNVFHLLGNEQDLIPEVRRISGKTWIKTNEEPANPGNYSLELNATDNQLISFNFPRIESDPNCYSEEELKINHPASHIKLTSIKAEENQAARQLSQENKPVSLWKYCIILALMFFLSEALIIKFVKT